MPTNINRQAIDTLIARARGAKGQQLELADDRETGLRLRAGERTATWLLCARLQNGKRTRVKLGAWPAMGVSDARNAARIAKNEIVGGSDPNEQKREVARIAARRAATSRTITEVLNDYERVKLSQLRRGAGVRRALDGQRGLLRALAQREVASVTRGDILQAVRKHAEVAPIAANRGLAYARAFFNWCVDQELVENNPAATIRKPAKERTRDRYHSVDELIEIWEATKQLGYPFGPLFRLLIALPMRREELAALPVEELKLDDAVWTLPAARTKRSNSLRVPLSPLACSIIADALAAPERPRESQFVFSMTGDSSVSGFTKAKRRLDRIISEGRRATCLQTDVEVSEMEHWTLHDLRTTFSTLACEVLGADIAVVDRILNHVATATTSKIMRVYNKSELFEPRKRLLIEWAELIERESKMRSRRKSGSNSSNPQTSGST